MAGATCISEDDFYVAAQSLAAQVLIHLVLRRIGGYLLYIAHCLFSACQHLLLVSNRRLPLLLSVMYVC